VQKSYWVYMLRCADGSFYVGVTNDAEKRVAQHNLGYDEESYTHTRRPVTLVWASEFSDVRDAIFFEKRLKGWSRKKKIALIRDDWERIEALARGKDRHERL